MKNKGEIIKRLRIERGLTQEEVGDRIGTSKQTLYKYETGIITNIPSDKIEALSNLFDVSPAVIMGWEEPSTATATPSPQNTRPLSTYEKQILEPFNKLNDEGKDKVIDYTYDLLESDKYIEEETVAYIGKAAAGNGYNYLDDISIETTIVKKNRPQYDFIVKVEGDSMEPKIPDKSLIFVRVNTDYDNGKIYVVDDSGTVYVKKVYFEENRIILRSINKSYSDIILAFSDGFRVLGEVVDWE